MTGYDDFNFPKFHEVADWCRQEPHGAFGTVINPAENFEGRQDLPWQTYLREAITQVCQSDVVVVLDGWEESKGARLEVEVALALGLEVLDETGGTVGLPEEDVPSIERTLDMDGKPFCPSGYAQRYHKVCCDCPEPPQTILEEAQSHTRGDRQAAYGHPMADFTAMGRIAGAILQRYFDSEDMNIIQRGDVIDFPDIPPRIATMLMQGVKLSREAAKPARDNRVDGAGYWDCTDMAVEYAQE